MAGKSSKKNRKTSKNRIDIPKKMPNAHHVQFIKNNMADFKAPAGVVKRDAHGRLIKGAVLNPTGYCGHLFSDIQKIRFEAAQYMITEGLERLFKLGRSKDSDAAISALQRITGLCVPNLRSQSLMSVSDLTLETKRELQELCTKTPPEIMKGLFEMYLAGKVNASIAIDATMLGVSCYNVAHKHIEQTEMQQKLQDMSDMLNNIRNQRGGEK